MSIYKDIGNDDTIYTTLRRYALIAKIFGFAEDKIENLNVLPKETSDEIRMDLHNEVINKLALLFGAGFISKETFCFLEKSNMLNIADITAAEDLVISQYAENPEDRITSNLLENALKCSAYSKRYEGLSVMSFDEALQMTELAHVEIVGGLMRARDKSFLKFLMEIGEPMGHIKADEGSAEVEEQTNIEQIILDENSTPDKFPYIFNMKNAAVYSKLFDKAYGRDFIQYAKEKKIALDNNCNDEYEKYVRMIKLHFEIRHYERIRQICGRKVNWFDYAPSVDGNISDNLTELVKMTAVDLNTAEEYNDSELFDKAIAEYARNKPFGENTVFEIFHDGNVSFRIYRNKRFIEIDSKAFHAQLFDFNKIWSIIQMCSRNGQLKKQGDSIVIPESVWNEIPSDQREYADRLIKEQYHRLMEHRKNNRLLQSLSELKATAENEKKNKEKRAAQQQAAEQKHDEDKANRPPGVQT